MLVTSVVCLVGHCNMNVFVVAVIITELLCYVCSFTSLSVWTGTFVGKGSLIG